MVKDRVKDRGANPNGESLAAGCTVTPIARHRLQAFSASLYSVLRTTVVKDGARIRCESGLCGVKARNESGSGYPYSQAEEERKECSGKFPWTTLGQDRSRKVTTTRDKKKPTIVTRTDEVTRGGTLLGSLNCFVLNTYPQTLTTTTMPPYCFDHTRHLTGSTVSCKGHLSANPAFTLTKLSQRPRASLVVPSILQILSLSHGVLGRI